MAISFMGAYLKQKDMMAKMLNELRNDAREVWRRVAEKAEGGFIILALKIVCI